MAFIIPPEVQKEIELYEELNGIKIDEETGMSCISILDTDHPFNKWLFGQNISTPDNLFSTVTSPFTKKV